MDAQLTQDVFVFISQSDGGVGLAALEIASCCMACAAS